MNIHPVRNEHDIKRFAAFHGGEYGKIYGERSEDYYRGWRMTCENLLRHHPEITHDDFLMVEDEDTGEVISTTCFIPWHCCYEEIPLKVAMLEEVATAPEHRRRGYMRALIERFHRLVSDQGYDLSIINGIPYYYRQYGYSYALDLNNADSLPSSKIPAADEQELNRFHLRKATPGDVTELVKLYNQATSSLQIRDLRDQKYWQFLLVYMEFPVQVIEEKPGGRILGYFCAHKLETTLGIKIFEAASPQDEAGMFVLKILKSQGGGEVQIGGPETDTLKRLVRSLGSNPLPGYQWLIRIPNFSALLSKIAPVLELRLRSSVFSDLTTDLRINLYREALRLQFRRGKLLEVTPLSFVDASVGAEGGDINIPPAAFIRLIFGYRQLDELLDAWPDIRLQPGCGDLLEILFPKMTSYFFMPWRYYGIEKYRSSIFQT
jgi:GNAT superfamily N-acetyltransferase